MNDVVCRYGSDPDGLPNLSAAGIVKEELYPYVLRVVRRLLRRTPGEVASYPLRTPTVSKCQDSHVEIASRVARALIQRGHGRPSDGRHDNERGTRVIHHILTRVNSSRVERENCYMGQR